MSTTFYSIGMKSINKCSYGHRLYSIKIDFRIGLKTTKESIGKVCPICDSNLVRNPSKFWNKFVIDKKENERVKEQIRSFKGKNPSFEAKHITKCSECGFSKWIVCRKRIPTKEARADGRDLKSWDCICRKCNNTWSQNHAKIWKNSDI